MRTTILVVVLLASAVGCNSTSCQLNGDNWLDCHPTDGGDSIYCCAPVVTDTTLADGGPSYFGYINAPPNGVKAANTGSAAATPPPAAAE